MNRELQIQKLVPVIIEPDKIGLDVQAVLRENDEGVDFAVPNINFEIRVETQKVYEGISDAKNGVFVATQIPLGEIAENFAVSISANNKAGNIAVSVGVSITNLMKQIEEKRQRGDLVEKQKKDLEEKQKKDLEEKQKKDLEEKQKKDLEEKQKKDLEEKQKKDLEEKQKKDLEEKQKKDPENQRRIKARIKEALSLVCSAEWHGWPGKSNRYFYIDTGHWLGPSGPLDTDDDDFHCDTNERTEREISLKLNDAFNILAEYHEHPEVIHGIKDAASGYPRAFIQYLSLYINAIWAEEVTGIVAKKDPKRLVGALQKMSSKPWFKNILVILANLEPKLLLRRFSDFSSCSFTREIVLQIAVDHPTIFFAEIETFEYQPWAGELAMVAVEMDPSAAIKHFAIYRNQPWAQELRALAYAKAEIPEPNDGETDEQAAKWTRDNLLSIAQSGKYEEKKEIVDNLSRYVVQPWAREVVIALASSNPYLLMEQFDIFKQKPWLKDVLHVLASSKDGSSYVIPRLLDFANEPWAREVFVKAATNKPNCAFESIHKYPSIPWIEAEIGLLAISFPSELLQSGREAAKVPWLFELYLNAIPLSPELVFEGIYMPSESGSRKRAFRKVLETSPEVAKKMYLRTSSSSGREEMDHLLVHEFPNLIDELEISNEGKRRLTAKVKDENPFSEKAFEEYWKDFVKFIRIFRW